MGFLDSDLHKLLEKLPHGDAKAMIYHYLDTSPISESEDSLEEFWVEDLQNFFREVVYSYDDAIRVMDSYIRECGDYPWDVTITRTMGPGSYPRVIVKDSKESGRQRFYPEVFGESRLQEWSSLPPERAQYLLDTKVYGDIRMSYRPYWSPTGPTYDDGLTPEEDEFVKSVWNTLDGNTTYNHALTKIAKGLGEAVTGAPSDGNYHKYWLRFPPYSPEFPFVGLDENGDGADWTGKPVVEWYTRTDVPTWGREIYNNGWVYAKDGAWYLTPEGIQAAELVYIEKDPFTAVTESWNGFDEVAATMVLSDQHGNDYALGYMDTLEYRLSGKTNDEIRDLVQGDGNPDYLRGVEDSLHWGFEHPSFGDDEDWTWVGEPTVYR